MEHKLLDFHILLIGNFNSILVVTIISGWLVNYHYHYKIQIYSNGNTFDSLINKFILRTKDEDKTLSTLSLLNIYCQPSLFYVCLIEAGRINKIS